MQNNLVALRGRGLEALGEAAAGGSNQASGVAGKVPAPKDLLRSLDKILESKSSASVS